jgi:hypothetical protein
MAAGVDNSELEAYLRMLAGRERGSSFFELRHRVGSGTMAAEFFSINDRRALVAAIEQRAALTDVYIGCAPRCRRSGTKRDVARVWVLWAECDGVAAARAAACYDPEPAVVVNSGSGANVHAYWPLREPLSPMEAERANLRLAHAIGADHACFDVGRILRPPGSWNYKHDPPAQVTTVLLKPELRFSAACVLREAAPIDDRALDRRWSNRGASEIRRDSLLQVEPHVYVSELLDVHARPGGKVHCPFHSDERPSLHV